LQQSNNDDLPVRDCIVPATRARWLLLHYHIFKNAGTTIEYVLHRAWGDRFVRLDGPDPDSILTAPDILAFLPANPDVIAISSHHVKYPRPEAPNLIVFDVCFLRDPLQRLWSFYKFLHRVPPVDSLGEMARRSDFRPFIETLVGEHPHLVNDVQVNLLANAGAYTRPPSSTDLVVALDVLHRMAVPGVVDIFDESLVVAEYYLRPAFPELQFQYVKQNVAPVDYDTTQGAGLREELGEPLYSELRALNRLDDELVARAREEVRRRYEMMPDREARRADFDRRCEHLRAAHEKMHAT